MTPIFWRDVDMSDSDVLDFFKDAAAHGIVSGLTIPLYSGVGYTAYLTFASSSDNPKVYDVFQSELSKLLLFGYYMHEKVIQTKVLLQSGAGRQLCDIEKKCLLWAAEGKTAWEIGEILSIKERTVVFHINNAMSKLGATNRQSAIAYAIASGEISANVAPILDKIIFKSI